MTTLIYTLRLLQKSDVRFSLPPVVCRRDLSYLCYLCLFACSDVQHILCCFSASCVSSRLFCQLLLIVHSWLLLQYSLTFFFADDTVDTSLPIHVENYEWFVNFSFDLYTLHRGHYMAVFISHPTSTRNIHINLHGAEGRGVSVWYEV